MRLALALICLTLPANAETLSCASAGLMPWLDWTESLAELNPGIIAYVVDDDQKDRVLSGYPCEGTRLRCPPDHVVVFHCPGNGLLLLAYEKAGCVTAAREVPVADFESLMTEGPLCAAPLAVPPAEVPPAAPTVRRQK